MRKYNYKILVLVLFTIILVPKFASANYKVNSKEMKIEDINNLPENSIERYAYSKAIENCTSFDYELRKEKDTIVPLANDEYVTYRTKTVRAGQINGAGSVFYPIISTEAKVLVNRSSGAAIEVIDFGAPYCGVEDYYANWSGGGFNINRTSSVSARISTTGQFTIDCGSIGIGGDIISWSANIGAKTRVMTISANMRWW